MFSYLAQRISNAFSKVISRGVISEKALSEYCDSLKNSLIDADTAVEVAEHITRNIYERAKNQRISNAVKPETVLLKLTYEALKEVLGSDSEDLYPVGKPPQVVLFIGLQGSGKTTTVVKYSKFLKKKTKKEILVSSVDCYRPAAEEQLEELCLTAKLKFFRADGNDPIEKTKNALQRAINTGVDFLILDTAGRSQMNEDLMKEIAAIVEIVPNSFKILVFDSMMGQSAVQLAKAFNEAVGIKGVIPTKFDSDTKGGSVLSVKWVTGAPVLFLGIGEKVDDLEQFIPGRVASRILGQGDLQTLFEKAEEVLDPEKSKVSAEKIIKGEFTLEDFVEQLDMVGKLGSFSRLLGMIPGLGSFADKVKDEEVTLKLKKIKAFIQSMTPEERKKEGIINDSRLVRISKGSGVPVEEIKLFLNQFTQLKKLMSQFGGRVGNMNPRDLLAKLGQFRVR